MTDCTNTTIYGDVFTVLPQLIEQGTKVNMCVTSPPYWGLRSYLTESDPNKGQELGSESTPTEYIAKMVQVFRYVREILTDDGTLWLNIGDSYSGSGVNDGTKSPGISRAAERLGRKWIGIELNEAYKEQIDQRTAQMGLGI
jgi:DNA modification methylase